MVNTQFYWAMILPRLCCRSQVGQPHQPRCAKVLSGNTSADRHNDPADPT